MNNVSLTSSAGTLWTGYHSLMEEVARTGALLVDILEHIGLIKCSSCKT